MKPFAIFKPFIVVLMSATVLITGCNKKSADSEEDPVTAITEDENVQASAEAAASAIVFAESMTMPASAIVASNSGNTASSFEKTSGVLDTLFSDCPLVTVKRTEREIFIDYGTGCTGAAGITHSGSIFLKGKLENGKLVFLASFNDFTANDYLLTGTVKFQVGIDSIFIDIQDGNLQEGNISWTCNGQIAMLPDLNATLQNPFDDIYYCHVDLNSAKLVGESKNAQYAYYIYTPLRKLLEFKLLCEYPYRGRLNVMLNEGNDKTYFGFDFEPYEASCDDVVQVFTNKWPDGVIISLSDLL